MPKFDAVVIGAGNGGLTAACRLAKAGKRRCSSSGTICPAALRRASGADALNSKPPCTSCANSAAPKTPAA